MGEKSGFEYARMRDYQGAMPLYAVYWFGSKPVTVLRDFCQTYVALS